MRTTDKVAEKLTEVFKDLHDDLVQELKEVKAEDVEGLEEYINSFMDDYDIDIDNIKGLEDEIENKVEKELDNRLGDAIQEGFKNYAFSIDADQVEDLDVYLGDWLKEDAGITQQVVNTLQHDTDVRKEMQRIARDELNCDEGWREWVRDRVKQEVDRKICLHFRTDPWVLQTIKSAVEEQINYAEQQKRDRLWCYLSPLEWVRWIGHKLFS